MKTKITFACVLTLFMLALSFSSKAQVYTFKNLLNCDVTISYEMRSNIPTNCGVCTSAGGVVVHANNILTVPICAGFNGMCIDIISVGGTTPAANHLGTSPCHNVAFGQSGTCGTFCNTSGTWHTTLAGSVTWQIQ